MNDSGPLIIFLFLLFVMFLMAMLICDAHQEITPTQYQEIIKLTADYPTVVEKVMADGKVTNAEYNALPILKREADSMRLKEQVKQSLRGTK